MSSSTHPFADEHAVLDPKHRLVATLASDVIAQYATGARVLDLGSENPMVRRWIEQRSGQAIAQVPAHHLLRTDPREESDASLSEDEAGHAKTSRGADGNPVHDFLPSLEPLVLPFDDASFDVVYCLNLFPHLGTDEATSLADAQTLLTQAARVTKPGGHVLVHYFNPLSLSGIKAGIRHSASLVSRAFGSSVRERTLTRWDHFLGLVHLLPASCEVVRLHGLNTVVALGQSLEVPIVGKWLANWEWTLRDNSATAFFSGEVLAVIRRGQSRHA